MKNFLDAKQRKELLLELKNEKSKRYADRIRVILLLDSGETYQNIAKFLFLDEGTIANYRKRYTEGGLKLLITDSIFKKTMILSEDNLFKLSIFLEENIQPDSKSVIRYIFDNFGVEFTISGVTKLLRRMDFSFKKAKAYPVSAKKTEQENFIKSYNEFKTDSKVYFADSTHAQYGSIVGNGWIKKGLDFPVYTHRNSKHKKINYNGAVCVDNLDIIVNSDESVNSKSICKLMTDIKKKNSSEKKLVLVLDNASYNRSYRVRDKAKDLGVELIFLPAYSPNLNPIERLWKFFKKSVLKNIYYETFEDFTAATKRFFRNVKYHLSELRSLLTDNFELMGT